MFRVPMRELNVAFDEDNRVRITEDEGNRGSMRVGRFDNEDGATAQPSAPLSELNIALDEHTEFLALQMTGSRLNMRVATRELGAGDIEQLMRRNHIWVADSTIQDMTREDVRLRELVEKRRATDVTKDRYKMKYSLHEPDLILKYPPVTKKEDKTNWAVFGDELKNNSDSYEADEEDRGHFKNTMIQENGYKALRRQPDERGSQYVEGYTFDLLMQRFREEHENEVYVADHRLSNDFQVLGRLPDFKRNALRNREKFKKPLVLIPHLSYNHWTLTALVNFYGNTDGAQMMIHFNSFIGDSEESKQKAREEVQELVNIFKSPHVNPPDSPGWNWDDVHVYQTNRDDGWQGQVHPDCGIFALKWAHSMIKHVAALVELQPNPDTNAIDFRSFFRSHSDDFLQMNPERTARLRTSWSVSILGLRRIDQRGYQIAVQDLTLTPEQEDYVRNEIERLSRSEDTEEEAMFKNNLFFGNNTAENEENNDGEGGGGTQASEAAGGRVADGTQASEAAEESQSNAADIPVPIPVAVISDQDGGRDEKEDKEPGEQGDDKEHDESGKKDDKEQDNKKTQEENKEEEEEQRNKYTGKKKKACDYCYLKKVKCHAFEPYGDVEGQVICFACKKDKCGPCHFSREKRRGRPPKNHRKLNGKLKSNTIDNVDNENTNKKVDEKRPTENDTAGNGANNGIETSKQDGKVNETTDSPATNLIETIEQSTGEKQNTVEPEERELNGNDKDNSPATNLIETIEQRESNVGRTGEKQNTDGPEGRVLNGNNKDNKDLPTVTPVKRKADEPEAVKSSDEDEDEIKQGGKKPKTMGTDSIPVGTDSVPVFHYHYNAPIFQSQGGSQVYNNTNGGAIQTHAHGGAIHTHSLGARPSGYGSGNDNRQHHRSHRNDHNHARGDRHSGYDSRYDSEEDGRQHHHGRRNDHRGDRHSGHHHRSHRQGHNSGRDRHRSRHNSRERNSRRHRRSSDRSQSYRSR